MRIKVASFLFSFCFFLNSCSTKIESQRHLYQGHSISSNYKSAYPLINNVNTLARDNFQLFLNSIYDSGIKYDKKTLSLEYARENYPIEGYTLLDVIVAQSPIPFQNRALYSTYGLIYKNNIKPKQVYIVFRGTLNSDYSSELRYENSNKLVQFTPFIEQQKELTPDRKAYRGFYTFYQKIRPQLFYYINSGNYDELIVAGHSLGGALGVLLLSDIVYSEDSYIVSEINKNFILLALPRAISLEMARDINQKVNESNNLSVNIVNNLRDVVPKLPLGNDNYLWELGDKAESICFSASSSVFGVARNHYLRYYNVAINKKFFDTDIKSDAILEYCQD